ncbi:MAG TPA: M23 family metallopeptidase [Gemmatimonadaceae bacterium]|nr:M23 family metallopeptidase [Gemmatimonadaceae bacterium]
MRRLLAAALVVLAAACSREELAVHLDPNATPHERYAARLRAAGLDSTALGRDWLVAADSVLASAMPTTLPLRETAYFAADEARAVAYRVELRAGQRLVGEVSGDGGVPYSLYVDVFRAGVGEQPEHVGGVDSLGRLSLLARDSGTFVVRVQPELLRSGRFSLVLQAQASLGFPVQGRGRSAIRSYYGADRDAGRRSHQGVDIFAPRGTPAVAAVHGVVRSTRPNRLGGNVVWLSDPEGRQSLYYAHLDTVLVHDGALVRAGDTLGLVGNTGNARSTPPHLHFGVYRRGQGTVNPFSFVVSPGGAPATVRAPLDVLGARVRLRASSALLAAPAGDSVRRLPAGTAARVVGAAGTHYRVVLPDGATGYVVARTVEAADAPLRSAPLPQGALVLDRPRAPAAVVDSLVVARALPVLARFEGFALVRTERGREGWVAMN